jgi:hypothetical protein
MFGVHHGCHRMRLKIDNKEIQSYSKANKVPKTQEELNIELKNPQKFILDIADIFSPFTIGMNEFYVFEIIKDKIVENLKIIMELLNLGTRNTQ